MKVLKIVVISLVIIALVWVGSIWVPRIINPKLTLIKNASGDDTDRIVAFYENYLGHDKLQILLKEIAESTTDSRSLMLASWYANNNQLCDFIPVLGSRYEQFKSLPQDSSWTVSITNSYKRKSGIKGDYATESFFEAFEALSEKCK